MARVNVPTLRVPAKIDADKDLRDWANSLTRTVYDLFRLNVSGGGGSSIEDLESIIFLQADAKLYALNDRIGSGDPLTSDETGFTVDSTALTVDMDEA